MVRVLLAVLLISGWGLSAMAEEQPSWRRDRVFCVPGPGECVNSCSERRAQWQVDGRLCDPEDYLRRYACCCLYGNERECPAEEN